MVRLIYSVLVLCCVSVVLCQETHYETMEDGMQKISMQSPSLTEEERHSMHMPDTLQCDACRVIASQLMTRFNTEHKKRKSVIAKRGRLAESDVLDIIESICKDDNEVFDNVGVKAINGQTHLSGPGLETENFPGMMQGGGKWPGRLKEMCSMYTGDIGEEEIYKAFLKRINLEDFLCWGIDEMAYCNTVKKQMKLNKKGKNEL
ncbi:marginal zone B- and B1-cell-specific protein-like isoform X2 [Gigantopelta aegis]|uniref:marginal zone B- and B1-cell-specific protein-like isoform X2 n=1 Tax=Gigantopelta aegis TaxID=1735272 RepID=UPI001B88E442|nr:marginal zone B- and B1-cell-specific protein-like isoform X2 [Gigantopelta aegis]